MLNSNKHILMGSFTHIQSFRDIGFVYMYIGVSFRWGGHLSPLKPNCPPWNFSPILTKFKEHQKKKSLKIVDGFPQTPSPLLCILAHILLYPCLLPPPLNLSVSPDATLLSYQYHQMLPPPRLFSKWNLVYLLFIEWVHNIVFFCRSGDHSAINMREK